MLWIGTAGGLSRFDGVHFNNYFSKQQDSSHLPENYITDIFQPDNSCLLITTAGGYLVKYEYRTGVFTNLSLHTPFKGIEWRKGFRLRNGEFWYSTGRGIARLAADLHQCTDIPIHFSYKPQTQSYAVHDIAEDEAGNLWLGTFTQQVVLYERGTGTFSQPLTPRLPLMQVHQLLRAKDGYTLYGGLGGGGLLTINTRTRSGSAITPRAGGAQFPNILCVLELPNGTIAAGTTTGLIIGKGTWSNVQQFTTVRGDARSLADNYITRMYQTRDGSYWIASALGMQRTTFRAPEFRLFNHSPANTGTTPATHGQFTIAYSKDVTIFGHGGGLTFYSAGTGRQALYRLPLKPGGVTEFDPFCAMLRGTELWVGAWGGGLYLLRLRPGSVLPEVIATEHYYFLPGAAGGLPCDFIKQITPGNHGQLLLSTWGEGVVTAVRGAGGRLTFAPLLPPPARVALKRYISFCYTDAYGSYWVANGPFLTRVAADLSQSNDIASPEGVPLNPACAVPAGNNSYLIAGEGGVYQLQVSGRGGYTLKTVARIPEARALQLTAGSNGNFWALSDKNQLYTFRPGAELLPAYNLFTELDGFAWSYGTAGGDSSGRLYFAGMNGFAAFYPDSLPAAGGSSYCRVTGIHTPGTEAVAGTDPLYSSSVTLPYTNSGITIEFSAMDFAAPQRRLYRYRLLGSGEHWSDITTGATASYARLAPGDYTFEVQASAGNGFTNADTARLTITVPPPFYATVWFRVLAVLLVIAILGAYARATITRLRAERDLQEAFSKQLIDRQEQERARVARELHDSIGQNLLVIKNLLGLYRKKQTRQEEDLLQLDGVIGRSIDEVRAISSSLHPHQLTRFGIAAAVESMAETVQQASGVRITVRWDDGGTSFGEKAGIAVYRIIQEALNNIVKHSGANEAAVALQAGREKAILTITDNGNGFSAKAGSGSGMLNMRERSALLHGTMEITSLPQGGTKLIFSFSTESLHA